MRLLNTKSLRLEEFFDNVPEYAILSHRWISEEVTFQDLNAGRQRSLKGWNKIAKCCQLAKSRGISYAWVDTCCIDKTNSTELAESINSMYYWYENARECYAYLSDVGCQQITSPTNQKEFMESVWFLRGWTLQELIAPKRVLFFNRDWGKLGCRVSLEKEIAITTSIYAEVLQGKLHPSECPVAQRLSWASKRQTTRIEDRAYSLLGLLGVNMPLLYGEREKAFQRLQEEFLKISDDQTIFAWSDSQPSKSILAPMPDCFKDCHEIQRLIPTNDTTEGFGMHNTGLKIQLQLIPWTMNTYLAPLRCGVNKKLRDGRRQKRFMRVCILLHRTEHELQYIRISLKNKDRLLQKPEDLIQMCKSLNLWRQSVVVRRTNTDVEPMFYGFEFAFRHKRMFLQGAIPLSADAICAHKWKVDDPVFQIETGESRMAGLFRLSGISKALYMFLGFDEKFQPVCLVTSRSPNGMLDRTEDFNDLTEAEAVALLDGSWLDSQLNSTDSDGVWIRFRGNRQAAARVICKPLQIRVGFEIQYSNALKQKAWCVTLEDLNECSDPDRERLNAKGNALTSPSPDRRPSPRRKAEIPAKYQEHLWATAQKLPSRDREALDLAVRDEDVKVQFLALAPYRMRDGRPVQECSKRQPGV